MRIPSEEQHPVYGGRQVVGGHRHELHVREQRLPGRLVFVRRQSPVSHPIEVVAKTPTIQFVQPCAGYGLQTVVQASRTPRHALEHLVARRPGSVPHSDVVCLAAAMNARVGLVGTARHTDRQHVATGLRVSRPRKQRLHRRFDPVSAEIDHPLLNPVAGHSCDAAVVFDTEKNGTAFQVEECHELLRKLVVGDSVPLELEGRILAALHELAQLGPGHCGEDRARDERNDRTPSKAA